MTDAHCHVSCGDPSVRELLIGRDFIGVHPWAVAVGNQGSTEACGVPEATRLGALALTDLRERLAADPHLGVGEIGLDRLKDRNISPRMREIFELQLKLAAEFRRPVVLHGAKCWGQVVQSVKCLVLSGKCRVQSAECEVAGASENASHPAPSTKHQALSTKHSALCTRHQALPIPILFHGFSRSDGLIPDIVALNGYISVGPSVLNDHAVNYRELVKKIPLDRLLVETDRTPENAATCPHIREVLAKTAELRGVTVAELERITDANADAWLGRCRLPASQGRQFSPRADE